MSLAMLTHTPATTDLCDAHEDRLADGRLRVLPDVFRLALGQRSAACGPAVTLKLFEDNTLVRAQLEAPGEGRVLVVDGGASLRRALVGGNLGKLAEQNGWAAILVNGAVRDAEELDACTVCVRALGASPRKTPKGGAGSVNVPVDIAGVTVRPGEWIYIDRDGILVSTEAL